MANNTIQLKRSSVGGKQPNTSTLSIGELAINITDKKLYSSDGTNIFEPSGNVSNLNVTGGIKANGSFGNNSQILTSNGSIVYWSTTTSAPINTQDAHPSSPVDGQIYWNSVLGKLLIYYDDGNTSQWVEAVNTATPTSNVSAADTAYSNAISYTDTKIGTANTAMAANAAAAYSNAVSYTDSRIIDSVTNTSITHAASANSVKNAYDRAIEANTRANSAQTAATSAYSNAAIFASNATNVNTGTLDEARLPHRMNQNVRTTDSVSFNDVSVTGNLTISGNTLIVGANNLVVSDAVISLHTPANLAALTSNDGRNIGLAFHYYDTEDKHALLYRDNTTGYLQYHTDGGDPISNSNPTGNNFGTIQAAIFFTGNSTINTAVTAGIVGRTDVIDTFISNTTTTTTQTAIDSFSATTFRSGKYIIQATNSTNYHYTEVSVVHDGTTAYATEFATMFTGSSLVSFAVDISGGNVRLLATATDATLTTYKIDRKLIKV
jgi:hypothetical protein